jgi:hypothetical protein
MQPRLILMRNTLIGLITLIIGYGTEIVGWVRLVFKLEKSLGRMT